MIMSIIVPQETEERTGRHPNNNNTTNTKYTTHNNRNSIHNHTSTNKRIPELPNAVVVRSLCS